MKKLHQWGKCPKCGAIRTFCITHKMCVNYLCKYKVSTTRLTENRDASN